jgi:hypothetical protein
MTSIELNVGAAVRTSDGTELGKVAEARLGAFRVDVARRLDFWLAEDVVASATVDVVTLLIAESDVAAYKMDAPNDSDEFQSDIADKMDPANVAAQAMYDGGARLR